MKVRFEVTKKDRRRARAFYKQHKASPLVLWRIRRNIEGEAPKPTKSNFWKAMLTALLTTQQRSGPSSPVSRFATEKPFRLSYRACRDAPDLEDFVAEQLAEFGGIRRGPTIADQAQRNFDTLVSDGWAELRPLLRALHEGPAKKGREREAARWLAERMVGLGPKQARNTLQIMGLTRFEVPLDSRVAKWLREFGFPLAVSARALSDPDVYELVEDGFQALCAAIDVPPTLMDAAIFSSFDGDAWTPEIAAGY